MDIDETENISDVCNILADEKYFYILANKRNEVLGYYLLMIEIDHPEKEATYLINWNNKLSIRQVDLNFLEEKNDEGRNQKYLVVSYKAAGNNTFNVFVFDVETKLLRFWHESFQLYESPVKGFLLRKNKDFLIISKDGINVLNLGMKGARPVTDNNGATRMLHALAACNYLRIEKTNHIYFRCQFYENRRICIQDQFCDDAGQTQFDDIYRIKIHEPTLRELLLIQSIYTAKTPSEVASLVAE